MATVLKVVILMVVHSLTSREEAWIVILPQETNTTTRLVKDKHLIAAHRHIRN